MKLLAVVNRWILLRSEMEKWLTASIFFSISLVAVRVAYFGQYVYAFLIWNLFLAFIPYAITSFLQQNRKFVRSRWRFATLFIPWLLFVPNTFYILTDLFHLGASEIVPLWYDLAMLLSFAWNGLLLGILSISQMERLVRENYFRKTELFFICPLMFLNAFGVYIGRYLRFNSWDVLSNPFELITDIAIIVTHPLYYRQAWYMVICFAALMALMYFTLKKIGRSFHQV